MMTKHLNPKAQLDVLAHLASHYPKPDSIPASFGEELNVVFWNTLEMLKGDGLVDYKNVTSSSEPSPLPTLVTITMAGMQFVQSQSQSSNQSIAGTLIASIR